jgi:hypothetical protein
MSSNQLTPINGAVATAAAETTIANSGAYQYDYPNPFVGGEHSGSGQGVCISGQLNFSNVGTGTTALVLRCRQGSIAGPLVQAAITKPVTAGTADTFAYEFIDQSRASAQAGGVQYFITVASTGLTVAGSVATGTLVVEGM